MAFDPADLSGRPGQQWLPWGGAGTARPALDVNALRAAESPRPHSRRTALPGRN